MLADVTKPASHSGIYKVLLQNIPEESSIKTVIVTLNLRSFNAQWIFSDLETPLQKSLVLLRDYPPIVNRMSLSFKNYDIKNKRERERQFKRKWKRDKFKLPFDFAYDNTKEWDRAVSRQGIKDDNGNIDYKKTELACHYIKGYAFQIDTLHNPRIKDFDAIVELARQRGWILVFNLMAENTEKAEELLGKDIIYFFEENQKLLKDYYQSKGVMVVDNLNLVADNQFIDQNWTTEHYAEQGRRIIAANVAKKLQKLYPDDYEEVEYNFNSNPNIIFFNDCDNSSVVWGQQQTLSAEKHFSGTHSSKVDKNSPYSITFEHNIQYLPDNKRNAIDIRCKVLQTAVTDQSKLVIQADKDNFWHGVELKSQINSIGKWQDFRYEFKIPQKLKDAENIKIYIYNPTDYTVFIDDFSIEFE